MDVDGSNYSRHAHGMLEPSLDGMTVLGFESRRAHELSQLISGYGGTTISAPSMREVPLLETDAIRDFHVRLRAGTIDIVVLLTGVGTNALAEILEPRCSTEELRGLLQRPIVVARGPKARAALRRLGVEPDHTVPSPNTWREVVEVLTDSCGPLNGATIAIQEYGRSNDDLIRTLTSVGATVVPVSVYRWDLPEDLEPLRNGIRALVEGMVDVVVFTSAQQCAHVIKVAQELELVGSLRQAMSRLAVASVGPITTEALVAEGFSVDIEPEKPKMGPLARQIAAEARAAVDAKRVR